MSRRDPRHAGGRFLRWFPIVLVLAVLVAATASYRFELGARWFGFEDQPAQQNPAAVAPPPGLSLPALVDPAPVASPIALAGGQVLSPNAVRRALTPLLADPDLGKHVIASVSSLGSGSPVFRRGDGTAIPASTTKLATAAATLLSLGPEHRFETRVVTDGQGGIVLVGGGDPFLQSGPLKTTEGADPPYPPHADVVTLARATAKSLREQGRREVHVGYDDTLFTGPSISPRWPDDYVPDGVVSPVTALWVDEGRVPGDSDRVADPSLSAATVFAGALSRAGIEVLGVPEPRPARSGAGQLAVVTSAPLSEIVERVLLVSDNEAAEVLARQVGFATFGEGSFAAARRGIAQVLRKHGVELGESVLYDGSGLSRESRLAPGVLVAILRLAASDDLPQLRSILTGLPVAGFTGSLAYRFEDTAPQGRGRVRAKTGTLTGVSVLAGIATDLDGHPMLFALMADKVALEDTLDARDALDAAAAALGACHCGR